MFWFKKLVPVAKQEDDVLLSDQNIARILAALWKPRSNRLLSSDEVKLFLSFENNNLEVAYITIQA